MTQEHLSDEKIQEYILQGETDVHTGLHISGCESCKEKMKAYSILINAVNSMEPEAFTFNVSELVMQKIEIQSRKERIATFIFYALLFGVISVPVYFISPMAAILLKRIQWISGASTALLITAALGVILFLIIDMFRTQKKKELQISL